MKMQHNRTTESDRNSTDCLHEYFSCIRKRKMGHEEAERLAKRQSEKTRHNIRAYKCKFCNYWHIGHRKGTKRKAS